jgi:hypothetical protein
MFDLSIIIVNWNVKDLLRNCLRSIYEKTHSIAFEIIVVDNVSSDDSVEMMHTEFPGVTVLAVSENLGFARANNLALPLAKGRYIGLLNPDTVLLNDAFSTMLSKLEMEPEIGVVGPKLVAGDGTVQRACARTFTTPKSELIRMLRGDTSQPFAMPHSILLPLTAYDFNQEVECISGACMLLRRDVISGEQIFDPQYFMYAEDADLCYEVIEHGWKVFYLSEAHILHYKGESAGQDSLSTALYSIRANCQFFSKRYGRLTELTYRWLLAAILIAKLGITWLVCLNPRSRQDPVWLRRCLLYSKMLHLCAQGAFGDDSSETRNS